MKNYLKKILAVLLIMVVCVSFGSTGSTVWAAKKVTLNAGEKTLNEGESFTLKVKGSKKKAKWSSSDKQVAMVNKKGKVKAKSQGTCVITAKVNGKKLTCNVTVKKAVTTDASYVLSGVMADGSTVSCTIAYDSSLVSYELIENNAYISGTYGLYDEKVTFLSCVDETKWGPYCYPVVRTGASSYEVYKENLLEKYHQMGDSEAEIYEIASCEVDGYTYYFFEAFYETEDAKGDPDIVYVQIGENEYIELYNVVFEEAFEEFIRSSFHITNVEH